MCLNSIFKIAYDCTSFSSYTHIVIYNTVYMYVLNNLNCVCRFTLFFEKIVYLNLNRAIRVLLQYMHVFFCAVINSRIHISFMITVYNLLFSNHCVSFALRTWQNLSVLTISNFTVNDLMLTRIRCVIICCIELLLFCGWLCFWFSLTRCD